MKKITLVFPILLLLGMHISAQKPTADFEVNLLNDCSSTQTMYTNKSINAVQYFWKVAARNYRECYVPSPSYYYEADSVTTTLIAISLDGQRDTITKTIYIDAPSQSIIGYDMPDTVLYAPVRIQFHNNSHLRQGDDSLTYSWNFGKEILSNEINPSYNFEESGTHYVSLTGKSAQCETFSYAVIVVKDTAQLNEFPFIKSDCYMHLNEYPVPYNFGKKYKILNDTLKVLGVYRSNCGTKKTATIRYKGDSIMIKTWEVGELTTCACEYYFEINIPYFSSDSAIVFFNNEKLQPVISALAQIESLDRVINIYPNPITNSFNLITADNSLLPVIMVIKDVNGRVIMDNIFNIQQVNVGAAELKSGIYIMYLYTKQGLVTKKLIKI
jgi:hypothetical protein